MIVAESAIPSGLTPPSDHSLNGCAISYDAVYNSRKTARYAGDKRDPLHTASSFAGRPAAKAFLLARWQLPDTMRLGSTAVARLARRGRISRTRDPLDSL